MTSPVSITISQRKWDKTMTVETDGRFWDFDFQTLPELRRLMEASNMPVDARKLALFEAVRNAEGIE
jgi:hypothetical protein